jgi:hypothetical protein
MDTASGGPSAKTQLRIVCAIVGEPQYDMKRSSSMSVDRS